MSQEENKSQSLDNIPIKKEPIKKTNRSFNSENDLYHQVFISKFKRIKSTESNSSNNSSISLSPIRSIREDVYMRPYQPINVNCRKKKAQTYTNIKVDDITLPTKPLPQSSAKLLNISLIILFILLMRVICKIIIIQLFVQ